MSWFVSSGGTSLRRLSRDSSTVVADPGFCVSM